MCWQCLVVMLLFYAVTSQLFWTRLKKMAASVGSYVLSLCFVDIKKKYYTVQGYEQILGGGRVREETNARLLSIQRGGSLA